ncbi:MAG: PfkB family carbohydrate kinase [Planctomycetota bacterium]|nr:PfkB family carbohydrate kinase [Planctomycetota bacterium]
MDEIIEAAGSGAVKEIERRVRAVAGKGINVARILGAAGIRAVATGFVGRGEKEWFERELSRSGARPALVPIRAGTRINTTVVFREGGDLHLKGRASPVTVREVVEVGRKISSAAGRGDWVAVCGSLPVGMRMGDLEAICAGCIRRGAHVLADGGARTLRAAARAGATVLKGNRDEAAEAVGDGRIRTGDPSEAAERLAAIGPRATMAVVTAGADGAGLWAEGRKRIGRCKARRVASTVGAGDAFTAGMLIGLAGGLPPEETFASALALAAAKVETTDPGSVSLPASRAAMRRVEIREV